MFGCRIPPAWLEEFETLSKQTGKKPAELAREAFAAYLGVSDQEASNGASSKSAASRNGRKSTASSAIAPAEIEETVQSLVEKSQAPLVTQLDEFKQALTEQASKLKSLEDLLPADVTSDLPQSDLPQVEPDLSEKSAPEEAPAEKPTNGRRGRRATSGTKKSTATKSQTKSETKSVDKSKGRKTSASKPGPSKAATATKSAATKPAATKSVATKSVATKPTTTKQTSAKSTGTKSSATKSAGTKSATTKSGKAVGRKSSTSKAGRPAAKTAASSSSRTTTRPTTKTGAKSPGRPSTKEAASLGRSSSTKSVTGKSASGKPATGKSATGSASTVSSTGDGKSTGRARKTKTQFVKSGSRPAAKTASPGTRRVRSGKPSAPKEISSSEVERYTKEGLTQQDACTVASVNSRNLNRDCKGQNPTEYLLGKLKDATGKTWRRSEGKKGKYYMEA